MTNDTPQPDAKLDALFATIARHRDQQCAAIDGEAEAQARDIVARAHRDARAKVHNAIVEERRSGDRTIDQQRARIETAKRQNLQDKENAFLDAAWTQLTAALETRWQEDATRRDWVHGTVEMALAHLNPGAWRVEHPTAWSVAELDPFVARIKALSGEAPELVVAPDLKMGIRITANGATVDGSFKGVSADRGEISAMLLAQLFQDAEDAS